MENIQLKYGKTTAEIQPKGAQIASFRGTDGRERIWTADPEVWAQHAPVLFPVCGSVRDGQIRIAGEPYPMTKHGFTREPEFAVAHRGEDFVDLVYAAYSLRGAMFIVILLGIYWKKSSQKGAIVAMILTAIVAVGWVALKMANGGKYLLSIGSFAISETYMAVIVALVGTVVFSLIFRQTRQEIADREATKASLQQMMSQE